MIKRENSVFDATPRTHSPDDSASFIVLLMSLVFRKLALGALLEELLEHCLKSISPQEYATARFSNSGHFHASSPMASVPVR